MVAPAKGGRPDPNPKVITGNRPTGGATGDGGIREGDFIVYRDEMGNVIQWQSIEDDKVYLPLAWIQNPDGSLRGSGPDGLSTPDDAKNQLQVWYETNSPQWQTIRQDYLAMGVTGKDDEEIDAKIYGLVSKGIDFTQVPGSGISDPYEFTNTKSGAQLMAGRDRGGSGAQYGPYRYESTDVALSSASQAQAVLDAAFQQNLGRVASEEEVGIFQQALNMMEEMNPSKSIIEGVSGQRSDKRTQTTMSGFDPRAFAREYTMSMPEYANTFAATTFMDALDSFLKEPNALDDRRESIEV